MYDAILYFSEFLAYFQSLILILMQILISFLSSYQPWLIADKKNLTVMFYNCAVQGGQFSIL